MTEPQTQEPTITGPISSQAAQYIGEQGISTVEKEAVLQALGALPTKRTYALVADLDRDGKLHPDRIISLREEDFGHEVLPEAAPSLGLGTPEEALDEIRKVQYPRTDLEPIGTQELAHALIIHGTAKSKQL